MTTTTSSHALQCVRQDEERFRESGFDIEATEEGFIYAESSGRTFVTVAASDASSGRVAEVIRIQTDIDAAVDEYTDYALSIVNKLAIFSAAVRTDENRIVSLSAIPVRRGYEDALSIDEPLVFGAALTAAVGFGRAVAFAFQGQTEFDALPEGDDDGRWSHAEFKHAAENARRRRSHRRDSVGRGSDLRGAPTHDLAGDAARATPSSLRKRTVFQARPSRRV